MVHKIEHERELYNTTNFTIRHVLLTEASNMYTYPTTKEDIGEILRKLCDQKGVEIIEPSQVLTL